MSFPTERIVHVLALRKEVIVVLEEERGLSVMEKDGGKWREINSLEVDLDPQSEHSELMPFLLEQGTVGRITAIVGSTDGRMIAVGSEKGEVVVYDREKGTRMMVPLEGKVHGVRHASLSFEVTMMNCN